MQRMKWVNVWMGIFSRHGVEIEGSKLMWQENVSSPRVQDLILDVIWLFICNCLPRFNPSELLCILGDVSNQRQPIHEEWWWERVAGGRGERKASGLQVSSPLSKWCLSFGLSTALGLLCCALAVVWTFLFFLFQTAGLYYLSPSYSWRPRAEEFSPKEEPTWESHEGTKGTPVHGILEGQGGSTLKSWVFCSKEA